MFSTSWHWFYPNKFLNNHLSTYCIYLHSNRIKMNEIIPSFELEAVVAFWWRISWIFVSNNLHRFSFKPYSSLVNREFETENFEWWTRKSAENYWNYKESEAEKRIVFLSVYIWEMLWEKYFMKIENIQRCITQIRSYTLLSYFETSPILKNSEILAMLYNGSKVSTFLQLTDITNYSIISSVLAKRYKT